MQPHDTGADENSSAHNRYLVMQYWLKFESELPEGSDGSELLFDLLYHRPGRKCTKCGSHKATRLADIRYVKCVDCGHRDSLTAGTFFRNCRCPKAYLGAIRLTELGVKFSALMLSRLAHVAYDTAWEILKKIDALLKKDLKKDAAFLPSKAFERVFSKRSSETPARGLPRDEQKIAEREQSKDKQLSMDFSSCTVLEAKVLTAIGQLTVDTDFICEITALTFNEVSSILGVLELSGWIESTASNLYQRKAYGDVYEAPEGRVKDMLDKIISYLQETARGISRKYLHYYLARIWSVQECEPLKSGELLKRCVGASFYSRREIKLENAPLLVPFARADAVNAD